MILIAHVKKYIYIYILLVMIGLMFVIKTN
jgi:hypothetical protein